MPEQLQLSPNSDYLKACEQCQSVISDSRRKAIEMELELTGLAQVICSDCHVRYMTERGLM